MIVDTSALIAIIYRERGYEIIRDALRNGSGALPAPALVEFWRVVTARGSRVHAAAAKLIAALVPGTLRVLPFDLDDAEEAGRANSEHGLGNGRGGTLNMIDLMVYAVAKRQNRPILCTGLDYAATGIAIHPASRTE